MIRGATPHFDYVAGQCAAGLARASHDTGVPVAFGVLTTDTIEQAIERAGTKAGNKGADAALVALELANLLQIAWTSEVRPRTDRAARARSLARKLAMQALYQWQLTGQTAAELKAVRGRRGFGRCR